LTREKVIKAVQAAAWEHAGALECSKAAAVEHGGHPDWPWNGIVLSAATLGGSWRWDKRVKPIYDAELSWAVLGGLSMEQRQERFNKVGRYWPRTSAFLERMYGRLLQEGGPGVTRSKLAVMTGSETITFWSAFDGVGPKYARNIMMDVYHPNFRRTYFAIDSRIQKLLPVLGYCGPMRYDAMETFLTELAADIGIDGWDLDRLLYQRHDDLISSIKS
jgi:hypothetical protein